jgi:diaminopimelate epimerase
MKFTKTQGLGNDFIIVEKKNIPENLPEYKNLAKRMCSRNFGVGGDGLIIVDEPYLDSTADIGWRIFNSDGSEPQMCGNGIRCFAKYVYEKRIVKEKKFSVRTLAGIIIPEILDSGDVKVNMGEPILEASLVPIFVKEELDCVINYPLEIEEKEFNITAVSMGNPHCVIFKDEDTEIFARKFGSIIEILDIFPEKTNVEMVKVLSRDRIRVDVWERGCGITLACGTGACASVVASVLNEYTENKVTVELPGGELSIEWDKVTNRVFMTGKAEFVFEGDYFI